jgi:hypothetical protein
LRRSLDAIEAEVPAIHRLLCERLGRLPVRLVIDDEHVVVANAGTRLALVADLDGCGTQFRSDRATLLDLVHGRSTFLDAVVAGRVDLTGAVGDLLGFYDALQVYLHGAVRSPSLPSLLDEFGGASREHRTGTD